MNDLKTKLTLDGSDFSKQLNNAESSVNEFQKKTQDASKTVDNMGKATKRSASELLKEMKNMEGLGRSTSNYRQQLAQMTRQIQDLSLNYGKMTNEMKQSDFGREVASQIQELTKQAAEYRDKIDDATKATRLLASDTANLDAAKSAIDGLSAAMQLFASAGILGEENTEKVVKALAKLKAIESATNAVIKIANTFNKDNILMLKLRTTWTNAQTKAQLANNDATNKGSKAVKTLTTVIKSCPYALVATAIIAIVAAYVRWSEKTHQQIEMQRKLGRRLNEDTESYKKYGDAVGSSVGKVIVQFERLEKKYKALKTFNDKKAFLSAYKNEMEKLGIKAKNVNDLEDIFIKNTDDYKRAIEMKAEYLALQGLIEEAYAEYYKKAATASQQGNRYQKGDRLTNIQDYFDLHNLVEGVDYTVIDRDFYGKIIAELTGSGARKMSNAMTETFNEAAGNGARRAVQTYIDRLSEIDDDPRYKQLFGGSDNTPTEDPSSSKSKKGSLAWYDNQIQALQDLIKNEKLSQQELDNINKKIEQLEKDKLDYIHSLRGGALELIPTLQSIKPEQTLGNLQKYYDEHPLQVKVEVEENNISLLEEVDSTLSSFNAITSSINSVYSTWANMADTIENNNPFELTLYVLGSIFSTLQSICSVIDTMNTLSEVFEGISTATWLLDKKKNQEKAKEIGLETALTGVKSANATADTIGAAASVAKSASATPVVGWILALAAVAGIIALIASSKSAAKFAQGGIVPGTSFSGDKVTAQLNSGEMVLNTKQQHNLFNLLNNPNAANGTDGQVEFTIKGQDLKGVLRNYDTKINRI